MPTQKPKTISFPLKFESKPNDSLEMVAFLFSRNGKLLEKTEVKKDKVSFKKKIADPKKVRVLLAPKSRGVNSATKLSVLKSKFKAYEPKLTVTNGLVEMLPIPEILLPGWFIKSCRVRGNVTKLFEISGVSERLLLCNMRVHICEVDRLIFRVPRLPDDILVRIPDLIIDPEIPIPVPVDPPLPDPLPGPDPLPFATRIDRASNLFSASRRLRSNIRRTIQPLRENVDLTLAHERFGKEITAQLMSRDPATIQQVIQTNFQLFHPIFCWVPWLWPYFYRCDELAVVQTDENGQFDTTIWYHVFGDKPDLYFWVEAFIDGEWKTVYRPNIPCNTYWDYECGREIEINVTDPRVMWGCDQEIGGEMIWVKTIGHGTSVSHIQQANGTGAAIQGTTMNRIGLTDKTHAEGDFRSPFGTSLYFILQFSSGLPVNKYSYYRWSYQKIRNADLSPAANSMEPLTNGMSKRYTFEVERPDNTKYFDADNFKLGPFTVGTTENLYHITPPSPEDAPVNAPAAIAADSAGNKVTDIPNQFFQMPHYDTFAPSIDAPGINLNNSGAGVCESYKMKLRIDNSKCEAEIYKLEINDLNDPANGFEEANPSCCGFVPYPANSEVKVEFRAYHPQNFANYSFRVNKGTCGSVAPALSSGMVLSKIGNPPVGGSVNGYVRNVQSRFTKVLTPAQLLGTCFAEGKAAFAERLYLDALAVNGNQRINAFDASALAAFALEPE